LRVASDSVRRMRSPLALFPVAALLTLALAAPAGAATTGSCPSVTVTPATAAGALSAGRYRVAADGLTCGQAATVVQSYLYDPASFRGWKLSVRDGVVSVGRAAPSARDAATSVCNLFTVVHSDTEVGFPSGVYHRLNFFKTAGQLRCSPPMPDSYDLLRDYLLDGDVHGYKVGQLLTPLSTFAGCRFTKNGTAGTVGFTVWCDGKAGSRGACVDIGNGYRNNCGGSY
jgi:hypothetical protein